MAARNTRDQILREIERRGDDPDEVRCEFFLGTNLRFENAQQETATNLPAGELLAVVCRSENWTYEVREENDIQVTPTRTE